MFVIPYYVYQLITVSVIRGNPVVVVSGDFICQSVTSHPTEYIYSQDIPVLVCELTSARMTKRKCPEKRLRQNTFLKGAKSKKINNRTILPFTFKEFGISLIFCVILKVYT
jgi:hypothetical protein